MSFDRVFELCSSTDQHLPIASIESSCHKYDNDTYLHELLVILFQKLYLPLAVILSIRHGFLHSSSKSIGITDLTGLYVPSLQICTLIYRIVELTTFYKFIHPSLYKATSPLTKTDPWPEPLSPTIVMEKHKE